MGLNKIPSRKIEPIGPVELAASRVIKSIRERAKISLDARVGYREFKQVIEPLARKEAGAYTGTIKKPLLEYLERILLKPREQDRKRDRKIIEGMVTNTGTSIRIEVMESYANMLFDTLINMIETSTSSNYNEAKQALWGQYLSANLATFGSHAIYNKTMDTIEKTRKRHLPRKTELKHTNKINEEALAN